MTRRGGLSAVDAEQLTPFARLIYDYLLSFRPNKTVNTFAAECGVSGQAVWDWLHGNTIPRRSTIDLIAAATSLPLNDLLHAAGLLDTEERIAERRRNKRALTTIMRGYEAALDQLTADNPAFTAEQRTMLLDWIRNEVPALMLRGGDLAELLPDLGDTTDSPTSIDDSSAASHR